MIDLAGSHEGKPLRCIMIGLPAEQIIAGDSRQAGFITQDGAAQRLFREGGFLQMIEHDVIRRVARFAELLQHDFLFANDIVCIKARAGNEIGDQIDAQRQIARQQAGVKHRGVAAGPGVELATHILHLLRNGAGRAALCALEHHVLKQVGEAVQFRPLEARAGFGGHRDRRRFEAGQRPAGDAQAVFEDADLRFGHLARARSAM